jgi:hypothetical protein
VQKKDKEGQAVEWRKTKLAEAMRIRNSHVCPRNQATPPPEIGIRLEGMLIRPLFLPPILIRAGLPALPSPPTLLPSVRLPSNILQATVFNSTSNLSHNFNAHISRPSNHADDPITLYPPSHPLSLF